MRIELTTSSLPRKCSTTELQRQKKTDCMAVGNERKNRIELSSSAWKAEVIATIRLPQRLQKKEYTTRVYSIL